MAHFSNNSYVRLLMSQIIHMLGYSYLKVLLYINAVLTFFNKFRAFPIILLMCLSGDLLSVTVTSKSFSSILMCKVSTSILWPCIFLPLPLFTYPKVELHLQYTTPLPYSIQVFLQCPCSPSHYSLVCVCVCNSPRSSAGPPASCSPMELRAQANWSIVPLRKELRAHTNQSLGRTKTIHTPHTWDSKATTPQVTSCIYLLLGEQKLHIKRFAHLPPDSCDSGLYY